jgi:DNA-binding NtrC family response regulator
LETTKQVDPAIRVHSSDHVSLLFTWSEHAHALALREGQSLVVGRVETAELMIDDASLSRAHARLSMCDGEVLVEDLGSTNGCLLNGMRVTRARLSEQDLLKLGAVEVRVCARSSGGEPSCSVSHAAFMRTLGEEITRARLGGRCVTVLALKHQTGEAARDAVQAGLKALDRACTFAPSIELVLLPERDETAARSWLKSTTPELNQACQTGIASYPAIAGNADELVARALDACHLAAIGAIEEANPARTSGVQPAVVLSVPMRRLHELVSKVAPTTLPVLVYGETGAGKELVARAVHSQSLRRSAPFQALNCATIPIGLIESVLFGHERGAFTGADRSANGIFEQAKGGTVFLDEVAELSPQAQAALLRVLELRRMARLGSTREIEIDVRIVAATHRNLGVMVKAGTFRQDLLFRLDALTLKVPPLRERREEIIPLAELFLTQARERWPSSAIALSEDAKEALQVYSWPGNVRQLKNVIERAVVVCSSSLIDVGDLPFDVWCDDGEAAPDAPGATEAPRAIQTSTSFQSMTDRVRAFEMALIQDALEQADGNQTQAARMLGVPRRTLASKAHAYGMLKSRV